MTRKNFKTTRNYKHNEFFIDKKNKLNPEDANVKLLTFISNSDLKKMNNFEVNFINSLKTYKSKWSQKQKEVFTNIVNKYNIKAI